MTVEFDFQSTQSLWTPQPGPQLMAALCPADITIFGGSRGGGKSDCAIGKQIIGALTYAHDWNGLFLRKNFKHFADLRRRIDELIRSGLPAFRVGGDNQTNTLRFENGARILFTAIEREEQLDFFQGQSLCMISIEEACQFGFINTMIDKLRGCLRSAAGVPCQMFLTCNPGGPGHSQVKQRFISPAPQGGVPLNDGGDMAVFIPSRVQDNSILMENDPKYVERLKSIKDPALRAAWLEGDWDVVLGGYFDDVWDASKHIVRDFAPPKHWPRICGMDWGTARPFAIGWFAVSDGEPVGSVHLPKGSIVMYDEWYGCVKGEPNTGLRLTSSQVAAELLVRESQRGESQLMFDRIADTSIFDQDDGPSIGERFAEAGVVWRKADKRRIPGWENMRNMLRGYEVVDAQGAKSYVPLFYVCQRCRYFIETVPSLERDEKNWEDISSDGADHEADMCRYVLSSRFSSSLSYEDYLRKHNFQPGMELHDTGEDWCEITSQAVDADPYYGPAEF